MSAIPQIIIPPSCKDEQYKPDCLVTPVKCLIDSAAIDYFEESAALDAYVQGESEDLPFGLNDISDLKKRVYILKEGNCSVSNLVGVAAQAVVVAKTCLSYLKLVGGTAIAYKLPQAGLIVPLSGLYFKSQSLISSVSKWQKSEDYLSGHQEFAAVMGKLAKCISYVAQIAAYFALTSCGGTFFLILTTLTYFSSLYDVILNEFKEEPNNFEQFTTPPTQWLQI